MAWMSASGSSRRRAASRRRRPTRRASAAAAASARARRRVSVDDHRDRAPSRCTRRGRSVTRPVDERSRRRRRRTPRSRRAGARDLDERRPGAGREGREEGLDGELAGPDRGLQRAEEEVRRGDAAPPGRATRGSTRPPVRARTAVSSPLGSACASEPTLVPRLRIVGCATCRAPGAAAAARRAPRRRARRSRAGRARRPGRRPVRCGRRRGRCSRLMSTRWRGRGQPHRQDRQQALPAGEHLAVGADVGQHGEGLLEASRAGGR